MGTNTMTVGEMIKHLSKVNPDDLFLTRIGDWEKIATAKPSNFILADNEGIQHYQLTCDKKPIKKQRIRKAK